MVDSSVYIFTTSTSSLSYFVTVHALASPQFSGPEKMRFPILLCFDFGGGGLEAETAPKPHIKFTACK